MSRRFADASHATSEITKNLDKPISDNNETHIDTTTDVNPLKIGICLRILYTTIKRIAKIVATNKISTNSFKAKF